MPRQKNHNRHIVIIGAGDCAANRLVPALIDAGIPPANIHLFAQAPCVFADKLAQTNLHTYKAPDAEGHVTPDLLDDARATAQKHNAPVIVATPSYAHLGYVQAFLDDGLLVGCEKPLTCFAKDIKVFDSLLQSDAGKRLFGFSYYVLEKGLPLTWFANPDMDLPQDLIRVTDSSGAPLPETELKALRATFDRPAKKITLSLFEGGERSNVADYRGWTVDPRYGGNIVETGLHPLLLTHITQPFSVHDLNTLDIWSTKGLLEGYPQNAPATYTRWFGLSENSTVMDLAFGKHIHADNTFRGGTISHLFGTCLDVNFDTKTLKVFQDYEHKATLAVTQTNNYAAQVAQFLHFVDQNGWHDKRSDFAAEQLTILKKITTSLRPPRVRYANDAGAQRAGLLALQHTPRHADKTTLFSPGLAAEVSRHGATLTSIATASPRLGRFEQRMGAWPSSQGGMTSGFLMGPVVGSPSVSGKVLHNGTVYEPGKHGFLRKAVFNATSTGNKGVHFEYQHRPQTKEKIYPFAHAIDVHYGLEHRILTTRLAVTNLDRQTMTFGCGLHPALAWPSTPEASRDTGATLTLAAPLPQKTTVYRPIDGKVLANQKDRSPFGAETQWALKPEHFQNDAFFFLFPKNDTPQSVTLTYQADAHARPITIAMEGWDGFGVWSKPDPESRFLCIEPLAGVPIIANNAPDIPELGKIRGLKKLAPSKTFSATMQMTL